MPALPLDEAGRYVAAAYVVFVLLLVIYVGIMAAKLGRISRDLEELAELAERRGQRGAGDAERGATIPSEQPAAGSDREQPAPAGRVRS